MRKFAQISISLKIAQGALAFLSIAIQSHALSNREFNTLSVIGNAILMTTFLDLGTGIQLVQNHLSEIKKSSENEDVAILNQLKQQSTIFFKVALLQSFSVTVYAVIYGVNLSLNDIPLFAVIIFITTFAFSIGGILTKALAARGYVAESLWYQLIGIICQLIFLVLAYSLNLSIEFYIGSLSIPNLVVMSLSLRKLASNITQLTPSNSNQKLEIKSTNLRVQILQCIQFIASTLPILLLSTRTSEQTLSIVLIYWRIFTSVAAATSSFNSQEWRDLALKNGEHASRIGDFKYLFKKFALSLMLALAVSSGAYICWDLLSDATRQNDLSFNISWILYVLTQVYQWHFYFKLLAMREYSILSTGIIIQALATICLSYSLSAIIFVNFPLSLIGGLAISGIFLQSRFHLKTHY